MAGDSRCHVVKLVWIAALGWSGCGDARTSGAGATDTPRIVQIQPVRALDRQVVVAASGSVEATQTIDLAFQVGGRVARVAAEEGRAVRAGDMVAQLDSTDYQLGLELATTTAARALDELTRLRQLDQNGSVAPADLARMESAYRQADIGRRQSQKRLADATLTTPISGIVARRGVDPGELVGPGIPVFTVVDMNPILVRAGIPEADIGEVRVGQSAVVVVPALGERQFQGRVSLVGVAADPVSRTYTVKVRVPNPEQVLRPGMIAEARVVGKRRVKALTVPGEAIVHEADGTTLVFVYLAADGRVRSRRVSIGRVLDRDVEVVSGLADGEMVVVGGQHGVRDGDLVVVSGNDTAPTARGSK